MFLKNALMSMLADSVNDLIAFGFDPSSTIYCPILAASPSFLAFNVSSIKAVGETPGVHNDMLATSFKEREFCNNYIYFGSNGR